MLTYRFDSQNLPLATAKFLENQFGTNGLGLTIRREHDREPIWKPEGRTWEGIGFMTRRVYRDMAYTRGNVAEGDSFTFIPLVNELGTSDYGNPKLSCVGFGEVNGRIVRIGLQPWTYLSKDGMSFYDTESKGHCAIHAALQVGHAVTVTAAKDSGTISQIQVGRSGVRELLIVCPQTVSGGPMEYDIEAIAEIPDAVGSKPERQNGKRVVVPESRLWAPVTDGQKQMLMGNQEHPAMAQSTVDDLLSEVLD